jgi:putative transposase
VVEHTMDAAGWLRKQLELAHPDLLRAMVKEMAEALMGAEADALCGAGYGERSPERINRRNGYRERDWDTRVGSIELAVPRLREGSYFPGWLLQPRRRAEQAFVSVIADAYLAGVSTRRVEKLVQQLGVERMSKSQVSRLAKSLDRIVEDFRTRPLDGGPYPYLTLDALVVKCREGGRTVNVCVVHAVGVNRDGVRESLGLDVVTAEDGVAWLSFLRSLVARGLAGVRLVTSDAHPGLVDAIAATLSGSGWQRCRTHFMRNLLTRVPKSAQSFVATMVRTIFAQPDAATVHEQHSRIVDQLQTRFPEAAALLEEAAPDLLAFKTFPKEHWRQLWSTDEKVKSADGLRDRDFGRSIRRAGCWEGLRSAPVASARRGATRIDDFRAQTTPFAAVSGEQRRRVDALSGRYAWVAGAGDPRPKSGEWGWKPRRAGLPLGGFRVAPQWRHPCPLSWVLSPASRRRVGGRRARPAR